MIEFLLLFFFSEYIYIYIIEGFGVQWLINRLMSCLAATFPTCLSVLKLFQDKKILKLKNNVFLYRGGNKIDISQKAEKKNYGK